MGSVYIPELDDAQEAAQLLQDFNALRRCALPGQRNRLLLTILEAIYVYVERREIVGLRPRRAFLTLFETIVDNDALTLSSNPTGNFGKAGGDGGESAPLLPWYPIAVKFSARPYPNPTIAQLIRDPRKQLGIGQSELAHRVGVSPRTFRAWEWSNSPPKDRKFASLLEVLGEEPPRGWAAGY